MMQIDAAEFNKVVSYIKGELKKDIDSNNGAPIQSTVLMYKLDNMKLANYLKAVGEKKERKKRDDTIDNKGFSKLWDAYPKSPTFTYKTRKFKGSRVLRSNYDKCQDKYLENLQKNPTLTPEMVLKALLKQKTLAYEESYDTGINKLNYWNGFEVWLNQEKYMAFIDDDDDEVVSDPAQEGKGESYDNSNFA